MATKLSRTLDPRKLDAWVLVALLVVLVAAVGCTNAEKQAQEQAAARDAQLTELQEQQAALEEKRAELQELKAAEEAEAAAEDGEETGDEATDEETVAEETAAAGEPAVTAAQLESQIQSESEEFYNALVTFINEDPPLEGEPLDERQEAAIRMKSREDILVAREYVEKGGDYRRAIDILSTALAVDPDNEVLQEALADVESKRYMTEERFAAVEEGMTRDEVREVLGTPYHANVRDFEEDNVVAWFYPVDPRGSASAVWFRQEGEDYEVYKMNFEEVVKEAPEEDGGESDTESS